LERRVAEWRCIDGRQISGVGSLQCGLSTLSLAIPFVLIQEIKKKNSSMFIGWHFALAGKKMRRASAVGHKLSTIVPIASDIEFSCSLKLLLPSWYIFQAMADALAAGWAGRVRATNGFGELPTRWFPPSVPPNQTHALVGSVFLIPIADAVGIRSDTFRSPRGHE
jgi:hypothetical protein